MPSESENLSAVEKEEVVEEEQQQQDGNEDEEEQQVQSVEIEVVLPTGKSISVGSVGTNESLSTLKETLAEFQDAMFLTNYKLHVRCGIDEEGKSTPVAADCNEFMELGVYLQPTFKKCIIDMVNEDYDVKRVRAHIKRTRDGIAYPPSVLRSDLTSADESGADSAEQKKEPTAKEQEKQTRERIRSALPKTVDSPITLGSFYNDVLLRTGRLTDRCAWKPLAEVVKCVTASGWNPPPAARRVQGDLMYLEVQTATEGTFHITATPKGFYVNKSNRNHFDPLPIATNAHRSHELFGTILGASAALRAAWAAVSKPHSTSSDQQADGALDMMATVYAQGRGDMSGLTPQWNVMPASTFPADASSGLAHTYDLYRAQEDGHDLFGVEELGAPREWNDEIQALRSLAAMDLNEKAMKARLEYKIVSEFTAACKAAAVAIAEGHIAPITYTDPSQSDIYVYNGIFFSKAEDTKDIFKICVGDETFRKSTGRDLQNQKLVQAMGIEGLGTVLCTIVDYKGLRFVGQSIIPGIFTQGENSASLLYGMLDKAKPITVKHSSFKLLEQIGKSLFIPARTISTTPFAHVADDEAANPAVDAPLGESQQVDALNKLLGSLENDQASAIRVDDVDSMVVEGVATVQHVGPVEGKLLKGSDGRTYALEMMRLTPMDANYLQREKGTGRIAADLLAATDKNMSVAYVLRQELVGIFSQRTVQTLRQALIAEATATELAAAAAVDGSEKQGAAELDEAAQQRITNDYSARFGAITFESIGLELNPNVFLPGFEADADPAVVAKDEKTARELAEFLFDTLLPVITGKVREGEFLPHDSDQIVTLLHRMGVNMRYIGQLARLAKVQEEDDLALLAEGKKRVRSMPQFWQEMLVVEMLSRSVKHVLNGYYRGDKEVSAAPAQTIATLLNHLFTAINKKESESSAVTASEDKNGKSTVSDAAAKKNKKKAAAAAAKKGDSSTAAVPKASGFSAAQDKTLALIAQTVAARFCFKISFASADAAAPVDASIEFLRDRVASLTLLRRICQSCGLRVATRNYDFTSAAPFSSDDVMALLPLTKSCEADVLLAEFHEMLGTSSNMLAQQNIGMAYELAQQAANIMQTIVGFVHAHTTTAHDQIAEVLNEAGDFNAVASVLAKRLAAAAQLTGLDSHDALHQHLQLSRTFQRLQRGPEALQHLLTAKYILELSGGPRHPSLSELYSRLADQYEAVGDQDQCLECLNRARLGANDMLSQTAHTRKIAAYFYRHGKYEEAAGAQDSAVRVVSELLPADDERLVEAKEEFALYVAKLQELFNEHQQLQQLAALQQQQQQQAKATAPAAEEEGEAAGTEGEKKKKRHAKKKRGGAASKHSAQQEQQQEQQEQ